MLHAANLTQLPDDCLYTILEYGGVKDLLNMRRVNKKFHVLLGERRYDPRGKVFKQRIESIAINLAQGRYTCSRIQFQSSNIIWGSVQVRGLRCTLENHNIKVHRGNEILYTITTFANPVGLFLSNNSAGKPFLYVNDQRRHVYCLDFNGEHQKAHWQDYYYSYKIPRIVRIMFILLRSLSAGVKNGIANIIDNSVHFFRSLRFYDVLTGLIVLFGISAGSRNRYRISIRFSRTGSLFFRYYSSFCCIKRCFNGGDNGSHIGYNLCNGFR